MSMFVFRNLMLVSCDSTSLLKTIALRPKTDGVVERLKVCFFTMKNEKTRVANYREPNHRFGHPVHVRVLPPFWAPL